MNHMLRTALLMTVMTVLVVVIGGSIAGQGGATLGVIIAIVMNMLSYWNSDTLVLAMTGARPFGAGDNPAIPQLVADLAQRAQIPTPKVYIVESAEPNAFATGRDPEHGVVAVTTGIMRTLNHDELAGVIAHELSHIKNRDTLVSAISASMAGVITQFAYLLRWSSLLGGNRQRGGTSMLSSLALMIVAPLAATLIQMGISRTREYAADEGAAQITGKPLALADALTKIDTHAQSQPASFSQNPATASLFIINPFNGGLAAWFSTHPPTADRVARLQSLAQQKP
jgi:heat shock protein HtpX